MLKRYISRANLFNTKLKNRTLYYDGDSVVFPSRVVELIDKGISNICVTEETDEIREYNKLMPLVKRITTKTENKPLKYDWNIPKKYKNLDVVEYVIDKWAEECLNDSISSEDSEIRCLRVSDELHLYKKLQLLPILRAMIYVINTLRDKNIVWGVGRGSSVSSYILYLIGVHDVDSVKYKLDFKDFLRLPDAK